jgi:hypothetical protein
MKRTREKRNPLMQQQQISVGLLALQRLLVFMVTVAGKDRVESAAGRERPCEAAVTFRCGAVTYDTLRTHLLSSGFVSECCCAGYASSALSIHGMLSPSPEIPKPRRRQFRVAHRVLDIAVPEISLQGSGVVPLIGKCVTAGVPQHVRMSLEAQTRLNASTLNHAREASRAKGCPTLRREHEGRLGFLLALQAPEGSQFIAEYRMGAWRSPLNPAPMQCSRSEVDLIPTEVNKLGGSKAVTIRH